MKVLKLFPILVGLMIAVGPLAGCGDSDSNGMSDAITDQGVEDADDVVLSDTLTDEGGDDVILSDLILDTPTDEGGEDAEDVVLTDATPDSEVAEDSGTDIPVESNSQVRFIHLSPDAPIVDVFAGVAVLDGAGDLSFGHSSAFLEVPAGSYDIAIVPAGGTVEDAILTTAGLVLEENKAYTGVAYDRLANLTVLAIEDDLSTPAAETFRVRVVHTAPDVGTVDIWNIPEEGDPAKIYDNLDFGEASDYLELSAGEYTLGLDVDGDMTPDVIFKTPMMVEGLVINIFAVQDGDDVLFLNVQFPDGTTARLDAQVEGTIAQIRFIHLSPDAPTVDVFAGVVALDGADDLSFGNSTSFLEVPAGSYDIALVPAGGTVDDAILTAPGLTLEANKVYTGVAYDRLANLSTMAFEDDLSMTAAGKFRVRVIHTAPDFGAVDIWNIPGEGDPAKIFDNVDFGDASNYLELPAGAYKLGLDVDEDMTPDVVFQTPVMSDGGILNLFAVQDGEDSLFLNVQFLDGITVRLDAME